jgi:hypothetical protein
VASFRTVRVTRTWPSGLAECSGGDVDADPPDVLVADLDLARVDRDADPQMTLQQLRVAIGDAAFFELLRQWYATHAGGRGTTDEFVALAEEVSGQDLGDFFHAWHFTKSKPDLSAGAQPARGAIRFLSDLLAAVFELFEPPLSLFAMVALLEGVIQVLNVHPGIRRRKGTNQPASRVSP